MHNAVNGVLSTFTEPQASPVISSSDFASLSGRFDSVVLSPLDRIYMQARQHVEQLQRDSIRYFFNDEFLAADAAICILSPVQFSSEQSSGKKPPAGVQPEIAELYRSIILTKDQEVHLFRQYNFLKWQASEQLGLLDAHALDLERYDRMNKLLHDAELVRNQIVISNRRLIIPEARRYRDRFTTGFLLSEGDQSLLKAVEGFDCSRGFRFSTYATWAIRKNFYSQLPREMKCAARSQHSGASLQRLTSPGETESGMDSPLHEEAVQFMNTLLSGLMPREEAMLRQRFGLDSSGDGKDGKILKEIAEEFGVTKERVRQILTRSMKKLAAAAVGRLADISPDLKDTLIDLGGSS